MLKKPQSFIIQGRKERVSKIEEGIIENLKD